MGAWGPLPFRAERTARAAASLAAVRAGSGTTVASLLATREPESGLAGDAADWSRHRESRSPHSVGGVFLGRWKVSDGQTGTSLDESSVGRAWCRQRPGGRVGLDTGRTRGQQAAGRYPAALRERRS